MFDFSLAIYYPRRGIMANLNCAYTWFFLVVVFVFLFWFFFLFLLFLYPMLYPVEFVCLCIDDTCRASSRIWPGTRWIGLLFLFGKFVFWFIAYSYTLLRFRSSMIFCMSVRA